MSGKYRTIVADPPWEVHGGRGFGNRPNRPGARKDGELSLGERPLDYATMDVAEISALPVSEWADSDAHLYLWTINAFVTEAYEVAGAWGFRPVQLLTWAKKPMGLGPGGAFVNTTEFLLFCRRGSLPTQTRIDSTWFPWKRPYVDGKPKHSAKPPEALDAVEQISPGPYLEMFSRTRAPRFGWDYHGDQSLETVQLPEAASS